MNQVYMPQQPQFQQPQQMYGGAPGGQMVPYAQPQMQPQQYQQPQGGGGGKIPWLPFITPVGIVEYCYIDRPQMETDQFNRPSLDGNGIQKACKKITLSWPKDQYETTLIEMRQIAAQARDMKWPQGSYDPAMFALQEPFIRDGDDPRHNTKAKPELRGRVYQTFKMTLTPQRDNNGGIIYIGDPGIVGPYEEPLMVTDVYAGCNARVSGVMAGTEFAGKKYISVRLNNVQKHSDGERRFVGGPPDAAQQFGGAPRMIGVPQQQPGGWGMAPQHPQGLQPQYQGVQPQMQMPQQYRGQPQQPGPFIGVPGAVPQIQGFATQGVPMTQYPSNQQPYPQQQRTVI